MSVYGGPEISESGLLLSLDAANAKSYPGYGTTWTDLSGNGLNATINNSPTFFTRNGGIFTYTGSVANDTSTAASSLYNIGTGDFTAEIWVKTDGSGGYAPAFSLDDNLNGGGILFYVSPSPNNFRTWIGNTAHNTTIQVTDNVWHHLVATRISGIVYKYIDGVLDSSHTAAGSLYTGQKIKLAWRYSAGYTFAGSISEARFYNVGKTAAQVLQSYNATRGRYQNLPFSPIDISGLQLWLDASDSRTLFSDTAGTTLATADGASIALWKDKSVNSRNLTQSTSGNRPVLKKAVVNSLDGIRFDGTNDYLGYATDIRPSAYSVFAVVNKTTTSSTTFCGASDTAGNGHARYFEISSGFYATNDIGIITGNGTDSYRGLYTQNSAGNLIVNNTPTILSMTSSVTGSGTTLELFKNNSAPATTVIGANITSVAAVNRNFAVGRLGDYNGSYLQGDIYEILIYNSALTTAQRQQVEAYLNTKWKVY